MRRQRGPYTPSSERHPNIGPADPAKVQQMFELVLALFPVMLELSEDSQKDDDGRLQ